MWPVTDEHTTVIGQYAFTMHATLFSFPQRGRNKLLVDGKILYNVCTHMNKHERLSSVVLLQSNAYLLIFLQA